MKQHLGSALLLAAFATSSLAALDTNLTAYTWGTSRAAFAQLEEQARDPANLKAVEATALGILAEPASTLDAKQYACRILRSTGSEASVAPLAALLVDEKMSHYARYALQGNPAAAAGVALREALGKTSGALKVGMITTLGARRDEKAVEALAGLTGDANADIAVAAMDALGRIGNKAAGEALAAAKTTEAHARALANARIECADRLATAGEKKAARALFVALAGADQKDALVRIAGMRGVLRIAPSDGAALVTAALAGDNADLRNGAAQLLADLDDRPAAGIAKQLSGFPPETQVGIIRSLSRRTDKVGVADIAAQLESASADVKAAAIDALGLVGTADQVPALFKIALGADDAAKAARTALNVLPGVPASKAIAKLTASGAPVPERVLAAEILGSRQARSEVNTLLALGADADESVRNAAAKALRAVAGPGELKALVARLKDAASEADASRAKDVLMSVVERATDREAAAQTLLAAVHGTPAGQKGVLPVLAKVGGPAALAAVQDLIAKGGAEIHKDAVRALADWRGGDEALQPLLQVATTDSDDSAKILALRGYIRIVADKQNRPVKESSELIAKALAAAARDEERTQALAGLGQVKSDEAVKVAAVYLAQPALAAAAASAMVQSAKDLPAKEGKGIVAQLKKARETATDPAVQKDLDGLLKKFDK